MQQSFLYKQVRYTTHYRAYQIPMTIDLVFTNEKGMDSYLCHCLPIGKSHHISLIFKFNGYIESLSHSIEHPRYYKGDYDNMMSNLEGIRWDDLLNMKNTKDSWHVFNSVLREATTNSYLRSRMEDRN